MTILVLTNCPPKLRGDITKWLLEINTGVYVGNINARVRKELWDKVCETASSGRATMVFPANGEQKMDFWIHNTDWKPIDYDGIKLIRRPLGETETLSESEQMSSKAGVLHKAKEIKRQNRIQENKSEYVVFDIETTGLSIDRNEIIEIAALRIENGVVVDSFNELINIHKDIPRDIQKLTGITVNEMKQKGKDAAQVFQNFIHFIGNSRLIAHNARFDFRFLQIECKRNGLEPIKNTCTDTFTMAKKAVTGLSDYKLITLAKHFEIKQNQEHRALADCEILYQVYEKLIQS